MDVAVTRMSSKGQIVIPLEFRVGIKKGDKLIIIKNGDRFVIKKASDLDENLREDLEFAKRTEEAWKKYEAGEFESVKADDFLNEISKW